VYSPGNFYRGAQFTPIAPERLPHLSTGRTSPGLSTPLGIGVTKSKVTGYPLVRFEQVSSGHNNQSTPRLPPLVRFEQVSSEHNNQSTPRLPPLVRFEQVSSEHNNQSTPRLPPLVRFEQVSSEHNNQSTPRLRLPRRRAGQTLRPTTIQYAHSPTVVLAMSTPTSRPW
jgi:hypothetical protein